MHIKDEDIRQKICLALDLNTLKKVREVISETIDYVGIYKIGKELFISEGIDSIKEVHNFGKEVFLDLKLHDIPNTVEAASRAIVKNNVGMFTIHTLGGSEMIKASVRGAMSGATLYGNNIPKILGVTILTSLSDSNLYEMPIHNNVENATLNLATIAIENGCNGIVCSAKDLPFLRPKLNEGIFYATPGINIGPKNNLDQRRTSNPYEAISNGSSLVIIGRAILNSNEREDILKKIFDEIRQGLKENTKSIN